MGKRGTKAATVVPDLTVNVAARAEISLLTDKQWEFCKLFFMPGDTYANAAVCYQLAYEQPDLEDGVAASRGWMIMKDENVQVVMGEILRAVGFNDIAVDLQLNDLIRAPLVDDRVRVKAIDIYNKLQNRYAEAAPAIINVNNQVQVNIFNDEKRRSIAERILSRGRIVDDRSGQGASS